MIRVCDILISFFGLLFLSPLFLIVALWIVIDNPGPVFYRQQRVGKDNKDFGLLKFRSMRVGADKMSLITIGDRDPRVTRAGYYIRKYKLDELPELWDVLIGNMSFVGPRPDVPGYADKLQGEDRVILTLRPGITGPASLKYRNEEELLARVENPQEYNDRVIYPDKVRINRYYLHNYSFLKDVQMIVCTVLGRKMMYGGELI